MDELMQKHVHWLQSQSIAAGQKAGAGEAAARNQQELEERLHHKALEQYWMAAEDPSEEKFEKIWDTSGRADALAANQVLQNAMTRIRRR